MTSPKPLRVLFINRNCVPSVGGIQAFLDALGRCLTAQGVEAVIAATRMSRSTLPPPGLPYRVVYGPTLGEAWHLVRWAHLVHLNNFDYRWWALAKLLRRRLVLVYHSPVRTCPKGIGWNGREQCRFETHWRQCPGCLRRTMSWPAAWAKWCSLPIKRWLADRADAVVTPSRFMERYVRAPRNRTIPHGLALGPFAPSARPRRDYFLYVGRLVPEKGCAVLFEAMGRYVARGCRTRLVVVGDGPQRAALEALARRLGIADLVEFHGALTGRTLVERMQHALALVMPSVWPEAYGFVAVEAMSCGTPVIASASGGLQDTAGVAGLTFPPGDHTALAEQMLRITGDATLQFRLQETGRAFAARHETIEQMSTRYLSLYCELVNGNGAHQETAGNGSLRR